MNEPDAYALDTRGQIWSVRLLLEALITSLPPEQALAVCRAYHQACEGSIAAMLANATRDASVDAMTRALEHQAARLQARLGLPGWPPQQD